VPQARLRLGANAGALFRSALGPALMSTACPENVPCTKDCRGHPDCLFDQLFGEAGTGGSGRPAQRENRPRPLVLRVGTGAPPVVDKDLSFTVEYLLLGPLRSVVGQLLEATSQAGRTGLGRDRVRFDVTRACLVGRGGTETPLPGGSGPLGAPISDDRAPLAPPPPAPPTRAVVTFHTAARIVAEGRVSTRLPFLLLVRALLRRYLALCEAVGAEVPSWDLGEIVKQAGDVGIERDDLSFRDASRFSRRQGRRVPGGGVLGRVIYRGPLGPFAGLLQAGELLHVGKGAIIGQGRYGVEFS
jgi:hypothetical protein